MERISGRQAVILKLLLDADGDGGLTGADLVRADPAKLTRGGIYVQLGRLKDRGLVRSRADESVPGPPRYFFTITGEGYAALRGHEAAVEAHEHAVHEWAKGLTGAG